MNVTRSLETPDPGKAPAMPRLERVISQNRLCVNGLLIFISAAVLASYYLPLFFRPDVYTDDMCEHIVWYSSASNPALFQNDIIKTYFTSMAPLGYRFLFETACIWIDPRVF